MIKIIDDFLTKSYYNSILEIMTGYKFDWWYRDNITDSSNSSYFPEQLSSSVNFNGYGFSHLFWHEEGGPVDQYLSPFIQPMLFQILDVTDCDYILRAVGRMTTWSKDEFLHLPHIDFTFPHTSALFYVNETDGDTIFYKDKGLKEYDRVSPKPNRLVIFDGDQLHAGHAPTKHKNRILINFNFIKEKEYNELP